MSDGEPENIYRYDWLIKLYTKKDYNHASLSFDSDLVDLHSFGRKSPGNPFIGGFVKENIREKLHNQATCAVYAWSVTRDQFQKMNRCIRKIEFAKPLSKVKPNDLIIDKDSFQLVYQGELMLFYDSKLSHADHFIFERFSGSQKADKYMLNCRY